MSASVWEENDATNVGGRGEGVVCGRRKPLLPQKGRETDWKMDKKKKKQECEANRLRG